jgi:TonB family protein
VNLRNIEIPLPPPPPPPLDTVTYAVAVYNEKNWEIYNTLDSLGKLLVIIDGVIHEKDGMSNLSQDDIATMSVLKYDAAEKKYGEKGKNGAIEVTTFKNKDEKPDVKVVAKYPGDPKTGKEPVEVVQAVPKPSKDAVVVVEEMPEFPGGKDAMIAWIVANVKYPAEAVKGKITGKVYVNFIISNTGKVRNVSVVKSVNPLLNEEAKRVVSSMPDWKPGSQAGKPVDVQMLVPVEFKLK